jgi:hypothetical protein
MNEWGKKNRITRRKDENYAKHICLKPTRLQNACTQRVAFGGRYPVRGACVHFYTQHSCQGTPAHLALLLHGHRWCNTSLASTLYILGCMYAAASANTASDRRRIAQKNSCSAWPCRKWNNVHANVKTRSRVYTTIPTDNKCIRMWLAMLIIVISWHVCACECKHERCQNAQKPTNTAPTSYQNIDWRTHYRAEYRLTNTLPRNKQVE